LFIVYLSYMNIIVTKSQYQKIIYTLLDTLYGPKLTYERKNDMIYIYSNDNNPFENESIGEGDAIFRVYTGSGKGKGCKKDLYVNSETGEEIDKFIPMAATRKKLFSKTVLSYVNERTGLDIDCIEFWYEKGPSHDSRYNFSVKKNKKIKRITR
jgi:hypothetical protein